jgi:hypothetical protein
MGSGLGSVGALRVTLRMVPIFTEIKPGRSFRTAENSEFLYKKIRITRNFG